MYLKRPKFTISYHDLYKHYAEISWMNYSLKTDLPNYYFYWAVYKVGLGSHNSQYKLLRRP